MNWNLVVVSVGGLIIFFCGLLLAFLDESGAISDAWAKGLWGYLAGSATTGSAWALREASRPAAAPPPPPGG